MSHLKKFSYTDVTNRKLITFLTFISFSSLILLVSTLILRVNYLFPFSNYAKFIILGTITSVFLGNFTGKFLYSRIRKSYIITLLLSIIYSSIFCFVFYYFNGQSIDDRLLELYINKAPLLYILALVPSYILGTVNCVYLKICTGDFIDDRNLTLDYFVSFFLAISFGLILSLYFNSFPLGNYYQYILIFFILSIPFIAAFTYKLEYNPKPLFAQHFTDDENLNSVDTKLRDDLLFTYINFSFIITYLFIGYLTFTKIHGNDYINFIFYISSCLITMVTGLLASNIFRLKYWHIYSELLFPLFFLISFFAINISQVCSSFACTLIVLNIPALIYGFSLNQSLRNIIIKFDHDKRFLICDFSLFILPIPLLIILSLIPVSTMSFFIILYGIIFLNILIPVIYFIKSGKKLRKNILYALIVLFILTSAVINHVYFNFKFNDDIFIKDKPASFIEESNQSLNNLRLSEYKIFYKDRLAFHVSKSRLINLKRAVSATALFASSSQRVLAIDSNQQFYRNPVLNFYQNLTCIDNTYPAGDGNGKNRVTTPAEYNTENSGILTFFRDNKNIFDSIIDIPNITDQNINSFRYSMNYLNIIKEKISQAGVYFKIYDINYFEPETFSKSIINHKKLFKFNTVFMFSNYILIASTDSRASLMISKASLENMKKIISDNRNGSIFYNNYHILNSILFTSLDSFIPFIAKTDPHSDKKDFLQIPEPLIEYYLTFEPEWFTEIVTRSGNNRLFPRQISQYFYNNRKLLKLLKSNEYYESVNDYENETDSLFKLRKIASYNNVLRKYIEAAFNYKLKIYKKEASRFEKLKKWDEAEVLYKSILTIDKNDFTANYRIGLLYLTIQDFGNALKYINKALQLDKNHPDVLFQMGILMLSDNKPDLAIDFLKKAQGKIDNKSQLLMYLGLSYMKKNNLKTAEDYYKKAVAENPDDKKILNLLNEARKSIAEQYKYQNPDERSSMLDDEKDEKIDLPINKRAINSRLNDDEK